MKSLTSVLAGLLLASAGVANAAQPLSEIQMDSVSAGATAVATALAGAAGALAAVTAAGTSTNTVNNSLATATAASTAIAATVIIPGGPLLPAIAASSATVVATLP